MLMILLLHRRTLRRKPRRLRRKPEKAEIAATAAVESLEEALGKAKKKLSPKGRSHCFGTLGAAQGLHRAAERCPWKRTQSEAQAL